jgi:hypothetical protein
MEVALPDGGTVHVEYAGDVAPKVTIDETRPQARIAYDPFAELDRIAYEMRARQQAMMQQFAALQQAAAEGATAVPGAVTLVGSLPAGAHVSYFSSTPDARGCTQTVQYSSDGSGAQPKVNARQRRQLRLRGRPGRAHPGHAAGVAQARRPGRVTDRVCPTWPAATSIRRIERERRCREAPPFSFSLTPGRKDAKSGLSRGKPTSGYSGKSAASSRP